MKIMFTVASRMATTSKTVIQRSFSAGKEVEFGVNARQRMLAGVERLADAVQVTLGPKGRNVIMEQPFGAPKITKDGVTVAKSIEFSDKFENMGAQLVRQVASKTNDIAGDGTTTSTVLARGIFVEGCKAVAAGMNPMDLQRGITLGCSAITEELGRMSTLIADRTQVEQVATISANSDASIGNLIAEAMEMVGKEGVISVQDGNTLDNELEVVEGMRFDRGFISPYFVTDQKTQKTTFEDPNILIIEKKLSSIQPILPILESVARDQKPLIIIAEDVEADALATLIVNKIRSGIKICAVKAPGFGDNRKANLQDIAVLTGGQVISEEMGVKLENATMAHLGSCKSIEITKDDTIILDGTGSSEEIEDRVSIIRASIENSKSEYEKEKLQERLAKLSGGVAVIKVGGGSDVEVNERKDRVTDALNATRAAVEDGIVPGGGAALLHASKTLDTVISNNDGNADLKFGIEIIQKAVRKPVTAIANNAGFEGAVVVGDLLRNDDTNHGFDAQNGEYKNMIEGGIIDPTKVVRTALLDAASVAGLMTTTEVAVCDAPEPEGGAAGGAPPMGGGMGGMGGMGGGMF
jgi:chaperonin GroEL